ncbi:Hypothetical predicted protein [Cloeon dipterum]|uniref:Uncharacterized protein n=1 Tax=Cloeon dipterum TaxID=197152 RepID=A0A8S1E638_9INSE|nr:Hypothetical predicted protein [Cloeon dipterum]
MTAVTPLLAGKLDALADIAGFYPALDISLQFGPPEICCNAMRSLLHAKVATDKRVVTELENNFPHVVRLVSCMLDCFVRCWLTLRSLWSIWRLCWACG